MKFANFDAIEKVSGVEFFSKNLVISAVSIVIIVALILAFSGLTLHKQAEASSFSFVIAIDNSRSMEAEDIFPNRLDAAKSTAIDFVNNAPITTGIGIITFSGNSFIEKEITKNKNEVKNIINDLESGVIEGTDIFEAVITSSNMLEKEDGKAVILLSDGQINIGNIDEAIGYARNNDVIINSIAIGTEEGGKTSFGISRLDEDALKSLAYNTGGEFFIANDKKTLSDSFNKAMKLGKKEVSIELNRYLLLFSIIVFTLEYLLWNLKYRGIP